MQCPCGCGDKVRFGKRGAAKAFSTMEDGIAMLDNFMGELLEGGVDGDVVLVLGERGERIANQLADHLHGDAQPSTHPNLLQLHREQTALLAELHRLIEGVWSPGPERPAVRSPASAPRTVPATPAAVRPSGADPTGLTDVVPEHTRRALTLQAFPDKLLASLELGGTSGFQMDQIVRGPDQPPPLLVEGFALTLRQALVDAGLDDVEPAWYDLLTFAFKEGWRLGRWALVQSTMVDLDRYDDVPDSTVMAMSSIVGSFGIDNLQRVRGGEVFDTVREIAASCQEAEDPSWFPPGATSRDSQFVSATATGVLLAIGAHAVLDPGA